VFEICYVINPSTNKNCSLRKLYVVDKYVLAFGDTPTTELKIANVAVPTSKRRQSSKNQFDVLSCTTTIYKEAGVEQKSNVDVNILPAAKNTQCALRLGSSNVRTMIPGYSTDPDHNTISLISLL